MACESQRQQVEGSRVQPGLLCSEVSAAFGFTQGNKHQLMPMTLQALFKVLKIRQRTGQMKVSGHVDPPLQWGETDSKEDEQNIYCVITSSAKGRIQPGKALEGRGCNVR